MLLKTNTMKTYCKHFETEQEAFEWCVMKNKTSVKELFALVEGPEDNYSVVDLSTAIELGFGYMVVTSILR